MCCSVLQCVAVCFGSRIDGVVCGCRRTEKTHLQRDTSASV